MLRKSCKSGSERTYGRSSEPPQSRRRETERLVLSEAWPRCYAKVEFDGGWSGLLWEGQSENRQAVCRVGLASERHKEG
jgi:hypothetical protein